MPGKPGGPILPCEQYLKHQRIWHKIDNRKIRLTRSPLGPTGPAKPFKILHVIIFIIMINKISNQY